LLERLLAEQPQDIDLKFRLADAESWLGTLEERDGNLPEAVSRFSHQVANLEAITRADPGTAKWQAKLADALGLHASVLAVTGHRPEARRQRERSLAILATLTTADPKNRVWQRAMLGSQLKQARLLFVDGHREEAASLLETTLARLDQLAAAEPSDVGVISAVTAAHLLQARFRSSTDQPGAAASVALALEKSRPLLATSKAGVELVCEVALARVLAGDERGRPEQARQALALIDQVSGGSQQWQVLDAAARLHFLQGHESSARTLIQHLERSGYQPLEPWPAPAAPSSPPPRSP
jgi:hypothetical protein